MAASRKDHLIDTAAALFEKGGFHATGIDRILAEAGVAKMTLYNHFRSKDELIVAVLQHRDERFRDWLKTAVEARARSPKKRLLAVFDVLKEWFESDDFHGCLFINAAGEFGGADDPVHQAAADHKRMVRTYLADLAADAGAADADALAGQLHLLVEGATCAAHVAGVANAARQARKTAKVLIKNAGV